MGNVGVNKLLIILICQAYRLGSLDFPFTNKWLIVFLLLLLLLLLLYSFVFFSIYFCRCEGNNRCIVPIT